MNVNEQEIIQLAAEKLASQMLKAFTEDIKNELGMFVGGFFRVPLSLAARISGINEKWLRRNVPIFEADGALATVKLADLNEAIAERETKAGR